MRWGSGDSEALARANVLTSEELQSIQATWEICVLWAEFYENEALRRPRNPSARGRAALMRKAAELIEGDS